jgi:LacI family transcriptional regulator
MAATVLYVDMWKSERIQEMKLAGIRRYAAMCGWRVEALSEGESRPASLAKALSRIRPDGCIVEGSGAHADLPPRVFGKVPVVYLDCARTLYGGRMSKIVHDGEATAHLAFRELSSNRPSAYAVVGYREARPWSRIRERAFCALAEADGRKCRRFVRRDEPDSVRAARLAEWTDALPPKTAVFAVNDDTAVEVLAACRSCGKRVPSDMTLLGVDNLESVCEGAEPRISSVQIDFERAGYCAAKMLDRLMSGMGRGVRCEDRFGPMMLVRRESTRGFGRREARILPVMELIRREACNGLTACEAMKGVKGSRRLFEMRFREAMGHSVLDEILNIRLEHVCHLLLRTDMPIGAMASFCGFRSDIALSKLFHRRFGSSLLAWRKTNRES